MQLIRAIHDRQEETDAKLDALSMDVHHIRGEVTSHQKILEQLSENRLRQGQILERLSVRLIEQETDIAILKQTV